jgi:hypothetical protein
MNSTPGTACATRKPLTVSLAAGLIKEPDPTFGFITPIFQKARGSHVAIASHSECIARVKTMNNFDRDRK